ncbi:MAG: Cobalt-zinc-cadmium resistance protein CzcA [Ignavibacteria bacterium]|nr:Cobalt-zinc-cadmium resistance protein CzcA [Ignavibacteria bacterium]
MNISKLAVNNKVTVYILMLLIFFLGVLSYSTIPKEAAPSITIPNIFVSTLYFGVSPKDIENLVTQEIEKEVKGIKDVKKITSSSQESFSIVNIEFNPDVKIEEALQRVRDKVAIAKTKMPSDIEEPTVTEINLSEMPFLYLNLSGNLGLGGLKDIADKLSDEIEAIPGVLSADVIGGLEREVKVNVDANRLKYYNLSFNDIIGKINAENQNIPGGAVDVGSQNYLIRVPGQYEDPELIRDIVIKADQEKPIYIRDVAQVIYGYKERTTMARENGNEAVTLVIKKRSGENIINISDEIKELVKEKEPNFPPGVIVSFTGDESKSIKNTVHELENGIITGFLLVCMILLASMGLKNAFLVATSIPFSFMISFIVLSSFGVTMNIVVLFSLILVLGIIVDDAIVVTENIYRLQETEGYSPHDAALEGPREVQVPVIIATFTIISSFAPLLFFPGIVGEFMKYLPITLIVCLFSSLFVALVINPVLSAKFINYKKDREKHERKNKWYNFITKFHLWFDNLFARIVKKYEKSLRFAMRHKKLTILGTIGMLIFVFFIYGAFNNGIEFFPEVEPQQAYIYVNMPVGTNLEKSNEVTTVVEKKLPQFKDIEYYLTNVGAEIGSGFGSDAPNLNTITLSFYDKKDRTQSSFKTLEEIRNAVTNITTADVRIQKQEGGPPTGPPVNIEISGDDFVKLGALADEVKKMIKNVPGMKDLKDDFDEARPEIKIIVDREKASLYGLNTSVIASTIRTAINGTAASKYRVSDKEYDITVRLDSNQRENISIIRDIYIPGREGAMVPLTSVAEIDFTGGIGKINRKDLKRVVTVSANAEGRLGNEVLSDAQKILKDFNLPSGYLISYTGEQESQEESQTFLSQAFIISLLLVFFFLVIEFNSIISPIIIMFTIILSLIGVLLGLLITRTPFGIIMTGIGVISLGGIVVRNAIILLDFQIELEKRGLSREESVIQSGMIRLRPVFLTAAATILGLVPLTTGVDFDWRTFSWVIGGENTAFWRPMGVAIIFGLSVSTFLTLVVVPVIFVSVSNFRDRISKKFTRKVPDELAMQSE